MLETDAALRRRAQMSLEGLTNAGTIGSYTYHALSADGRVRDAGVTSPAPGRVLVTILAHDGDGTPTADLLSAVAAVMEDVRPLCDDVAVAAPAFADFAVTAHLLVPGSPGAEVARGAALAAVTAYLDEARAVGRVVRRSALIARLHQAGVEAVTLTAPAGDVDPGRTGVARATGIAITASAAP
ncbi:Baseplate J-like protein [Paracoccus haematequi]|uniref:Baseplate J-like protein n=1 Tax=Paracoccus haematequi TaxID=2491866 RepID=A0A3S4DC92_9RHOB|nr:Baseplate J-like protein [Paracoccus haematequi]